MSHKAEIIAVGSEMLLGNVANTDARYVSEKIASAGVDVLYHTAVGDNPRRLRQVTDIARSRCDLLIFIGGLGPTYDDLTKEIVCAAFGLELEFHQDVMEEIKAYFKTFSAGRCRIATAGRHSCPRTARYFITPWVPPRAACLQWRA